MKIVEVKYQEEATLIEQGPTPSRLRRLLQWLRLVKPEPPVVMNLFQRDLGAYRFLTDDGRACIVPVSKQLVEDSAIDAEALAREIALPRLAALTSADEPV